MEEISGKDNSNEEVKALIVEDFGLETSEEDAFDEEKLLNDLTEQVDRFLEQKPETFFSTLYRLDVSELKIKKALSPLNPDPPARSLAQLIIDRQKARVWTKKNIKSPKLTDWDDGIFKS